MVATMALTDGGDDPLAAGLRRLFVAVAGATPEERIGDADREEDERNPLLVGTLAWQRRERYRAERDKRAYTVEGAIRRAYMRIEETKRGIRRMHSREQDATGFQWHPIVVSVADMEAALTFVPNDRGHHKARWVYALVVGREPVVRAGEGAERAPSGQLDGRVEGYEEAEPRSVGEAAEWLNIPHRDARAGFEYAEATIVAFLCHEGLID